MKYIVIFISILALSACTATTYKKMGFGGGYKDESLADGSIKLKFRGNALTSANQVNIFWERRAQELCPSGYSILSKEDKTINVYTQYNQTRQPAIEGIIRCK